MKNAKIIFSASILMLSSLSLSAETFEVPIDIGTTPYSHSDFSGSKSGTKTYSEAISYCNNIFDEKSLTGEKTETFIKPLNEPYHYWLACVKWFYPFKENDTPLGSYNCDSKNVKWGGNCESNIGSGKEGESQTLSNELNTGYQGSAIYVCKQGQWSFDSGSCIQEPKPCVGVQEVSWAVTEPEWAVVGNVDNPQYDPKADCKSIFTGSYLSGALIGGLNSAGTPNLPLTSPPMNPSTINSYDEIASTENTFMRCFNGNWIVQNGAKCVYRPTTCPAQKYTTADGCTFSLPEISHNTEVTVKAPEPFKSEGSVTAFCFDGKIEIKSESCKLSCSDKFAARTWNSLPLTGEKCNHVAKDFGTRTSPNTTLTVKNENTKLFGDTTYKCTDGFWTVDKEQCVPKGCGYIASQNYTGLDFKTNQNRTCTHIANTDTVKHGDKIILPANNSRFVGQKDYVCNFGVWNNGTDQDICTYLDDSSYSCSANIPDLLEPAIELPSPSNPSCNITCKYNTDRTALYCSDNCKVATDCSAPNGMNGEQILNETNTACSYQAKCVSDPTKLCTFTNGKQNVTKTCSSGAWTTTKTECVIR